MSFMLRREPIALLNLVYHEHLFPRAPINAPSKRCWSVTVRGRRAAPWSGYWR